MFFGGLVFEKIRLLYIRNYVKVSEVIDRTTNRINV